ncbi:hypothetical protein [Vibrio crassostreae]|uniref:hypothetical protein n=1 Tax=Vibrio crassostreae TaxID=246167 RepID=UPI001B30A806|nr:hypothetical protein [Vibrio crassostreae]
MSQVDNSKHISQIQTIVIGSVIVLFIIAALSLLAYNAVAVAVGYDYYELKNLSDHPVARLCDEKFVADLSEDDKITWREYKFFVECSSSSFEDEIVLELHPRAAIFDLGKNEEHLESVKYIREGYRYSMYDSGLSLVMDMPLHRLFSGTYNRMTVDFVGSEREIIKHIDFKNFHEYANHELNGIYEIVKGKAEHLRAQNTHSKTWNSQK